MIRAALALLTLCLSVPAVAGEKRVKPRPPRDLSPAEQRTKRLRELVEAWFKHTAPPTPEKKKRIAKVIAELGSDDSGVRKAASERVLTFGLKALPQLRAALKSKDAEVVARAGKAIAQIEKDKAFRKLCTTGNAVRAFIRKEVIRLRDLADKANAAAAELEKKGKKAEADKQRARAAELNRKINRLKKLYPKVRQMGRIPDIRTKVVAVRPKTGHVALGAGTDSGVKKGSIFLIHRNDRYIGKVRITTVWESFAGATIVERKEPIKAGDDALGHTAPGR